MLDSTVGVEQFNDSLAIQARMKERIPRTKKDDPIVNAVIEPIASEFASLRREMRVGFEQVSGRLNQVDEKLNQLSSEVQAVRGEIRQALSHRSSN